MKRLAAIFIIILIVCSGCSLFKTKDSKSAKELALNGMVEFNNKNYKNAIESFEKLKDWYPFSKYAILAELKIADAHYHLQKYEEAVFAYEEFENLHPRNEAIPYVVYQIGLCYFEQIDTIDRDQTTGLKASETFKRLNKQFPDNEYRSVALQHINKCMKNLVGHEIYVGRFYYKTKHFKAALERFKTVLSRYPDVGLHKDALLYIALCEEALKKEKGKKKKG
jgi:outer membrane protein assembly factor BamD